MLRNRIFRFSVFGVAGLLLVGWCVSRLIGQRKANPEQLAERALRAATMEERQAAAIQLARGGKDSVELIRRVFRESSTAEVRAAAAQGLGYLRDVDSLPELIDAMEDGSVLVRGRAGAAVSRIVGLQVGFRAAAPPEERQKAVAFYRKFWEEAQSPDSKFIEYMKDPQKAAEAAEQIIARRRDRPAKEKNP